MRELASGTPCEVTHGKKVLIMTMPFASPEFPGLGPTLIRSILLKAGIATDIIYGNLLFSKLVEKDPFVENVLTQLAICEIAFTPWYFGTDAALAADNLRQYVLKLAVMPEAHTQQRFAKIVADAGTCVDTLARTIDWQAYDVVGFSLLMGQTIASLALAKRIKAAHPGICIIMGGANTQAPMGDELVRSFPEIDYVLQGEADDVVVTFIQEFRQGRRTGFSTGGVLYRGAEGQVCSTGDAKPFYDLDSLPIPDFTDYFTQMETLGLTHVQPYMPIETSRGCWWGEKHHCTFCGIDDTIMAYRSKSSGRALEEILTLSSKHKYTEFFAVDSIINFKFFDELLPSLGQLRRDKSWDLTFFFESKSNISRDQVRRFRYGGVNNVQPGLESFSDHVLELMNKGTTGVRQIQCLRLLEEQNIVPDWNLIFGNPGETAHDYQEIIDIIPFMHHLRPLHPGGLTPMQINRFAPYHNEPEKYRIRDIRPKSYYQMIYPDAAIDIDRLAFYFDCEFDEMRDAALAAQYAVLKTCTENWRDCYQPDALLQFQGIGFVRIVDRRRWDPAVPVTPGTERVITLSGSGGELFSYCNTLRTLADVKRKFAYCCDAAGVDTFVARMVALRLMYMAPSQQLIALPILKEASGHFRFTPVRHVKEADAQPRATTPALQVMAFPASKKAVPAGARPYEEEALGDVMTAVHPAVALMQVQDSVPRAAAPSLTAPSDGISIAIGQAESAFSIAVDEREPGNIVDAMLAQIAATTSLHVQLEGFKVGAPASGALLEVLARHRGESLVGFEIACEAGAPPGAPYAELMREAGICHCTLAHDFGLPGSPLMVNLRRVEAVRDLSSAGIRVAWELDPRSASLKPEQAASLARMLDAIVHLPPPASAADSGSLAKVLDQWRAHHVIRTLTFARGPAFMRIFDRRGENDHWRFITLRETQGDILQFCDKVRGMDAINAAFPAFSRVELQRFLDTLVSQRILACSDTGDYLNLVVRRSIEERWASADR